MTKYIMPIIKDKEKREQKKDVRIPLYRSPPMPYPLEKEEEEKDDDTDKNIIDFNIDGNIVEISIRV
jgi:hypothetical protein